MTTFAIYLALGALLGCAAVLALDVLSRLEEATMRTMRIETGDTIHIPRGKLPEMPDGGALKVVRVQPTGLVEVLCRLGRFYRIPIVMPADDWCHLVWLSEHGWPVEEPVPPYEPEYGGEA